MRSFSRARLRDIRLPGSSSSGVLLTRYSTRRLISVDAPHISSRATITTQRSAAAINHNLTTCYAQLASTNISRRALHLTSSVRKNINTPSNSSSSTVSSHENHKPKKLTPAKITTDEYHRLANDFLEDLLTKLEDIQEERKEVDVDYAVSFLFPLLSICLTMEFA